MTLRILLIAALVAGAVWAQQRGGGGTNQRTGMPSSNDPFGTNRNTRTNNPNAGRKADAAKSKNRLETISEQLKLDKDQKKQLKSFFDAAAKQAAPVRDQIRQNRQEMAAAMAAGKSEAEINEIAAKQAPLVAQMLAVETKAFGQVVGILKDDQKKRAGGVFAERVAGIFQGRRWTDPE